MTPKMTANVSENTWSLVPLYARKTILTLQLLSLYCYWLTVATDGNWEWFYRISRQCRSLRNGRMRIHLGSGTWAASSSLNDCYSGHNAWRLCHVMQCPPPAKSHIERRYAVTLSSDLIIPRCSPSVMLSAQAAMHDSPPYGPSFISSIKAAAAARLITSTRTTSWWLVLV